jgi:hypothetical protein
MTEKLLNYNSVYSEFKNQGASAEPARLLTLQQVEALEEIIKDDNSWNFLLKAAEAGRNEDAWLAQDWPDGFDELLLCVPLCKLVDWECQKCIVGKRQNNYSCANDDSLFGWVGELVKNQDRAALKNHISSIKKILEKESPYMWNMKKHIAEIP